ncbi:MAG: hypothetical protein KC933_09680 [Myxococcales bacterium]|nr:hypothetical protein [Myxococcales bacterium]
MSAVTAKDDKLLEARFTRPLSPREVARLERALASSPELAERYRRLQLAERVVAHGPEAGLEQPSPFEVERGARALGLLDPPARRRPAWTPWVLGATFAMAAGLATLVVAPVGMQEVLQERGGAVSGVSFAAYAVAPEGGFSELVEGARLTPEHRLKLRLSFQGPATPLDAVWVALVPTSGAPRVERLAAPEGNLAAVPGVVGLFGLPAGPVAVYVLAAARGASPGEISAAVAGRPAPEALATDPRWSGVLRTDVVPSEEPAR